MSRALSFAFIVSVLACQACAFSMPTQMRGKKLIREAPKSWQKEIDKCEEQFFDQSLDHFHFDTKPITFKQRVIVCKQFWKKTELGTMGPIFFYAGNEGDVMTYVNNTGLMWENAEHFSALLIFAEHRYYGKTQPLGPNSYLIEPSFLTVEQALSDFATIIYDWKTNRVPDFDKVPVIAFGGSYGGMLAAWLRVKYPHIVQGAIAASAPVAAFPGAAGFNPALFWEIVTSNARPEAGAAEDCVENVRKVFKGVEILGMADDGRMALYKYLSLCSVPQDFGEVLAVLYWLLGAFDAYAMGNYPYASSYMNGDPDHPLPAWPMRQACLAMTGRGDSPVELLMGMRDAVGILYNATGKEACYDVTNMDGPAAGSIGAWDYQFCTEMMGQEVPYYPSNGQTDMFWDQGKVNLTSINTHCQKHWKVIPKPLWMATTFPTSSFHFQSNIAFSWGALDPWTFGCITQTQAPSVISIPIAEGAHHLDLMFSHPDDPPSVIEARAREKTLIYEFCYVNTQAAMMKKVEQMEKKGNAKKEKAEKKKNEEDKVVEGAEL